MKFENLKIVDAENKITNALWSFPISCFETKNFHNWVFINDEDAFNCLIENIATDSGMSNLLNDNAVRQMRKDIAFDSWNYIIIGKNKRNDVTMFIKSAKAVLKELLSAIPTKQQHDEVVEFG